MKCYLVIHTKDGSPYAGPYMDLKQCRTLITEHKNSYSTAKEEDLIIVEYIPYTYYTYKDKELKECKNYNTIYGQ